MKKILITSVLLFVAFALFFSCSDENLADTGTTTLYDTQLQFKSVTVFNNRPESGKGTITEFVNGDTIGLYLHEYYRGNPFPYTARERYGWYLPEPIFLGSNPMRIMAYYPYMHSKHAYLWNIYLDVEHISQTDYMHGQVGGGYVSREHSYADIVMWHVLTLVQFKFIKNEYPHDCSVQKVSIQNADGITHLKSKGILNVESGEVKPSDGYYDQAVIIPEDMNFYEPYTSEEEYPRILVMPIEPVKNDGDLFFEFEIDGQIYTYPLKAGTHWQSGMKYTYQVEMVSGARTLKSSGKSIDISAVLTQISSYE
ncbi:MAG TPA: fimbrillin family protein [Dysgonomonas sp.]|uniref:fimbrillin family protein n=1 Tax=unclassified Dysgonomonas TaxID=2630389 RepID=UPI0025BDAA0D|nr:MULTISPECIES: fimbrillin family protein [unclassified Dysgonomonas]HML66572.1 fimbrillin family protein [Dysgonomonas sp.]